MSFLGNFEGSIEVEFKILFYSEKLLLKSKREVKEIWKIFKERKSNFVEILNFLLME